MNALVVSIQPVPRKLEENMNSLKMLFLHS